MSFQPEERYWTDYLRIALPVMGILLLVVLLWFWLQALIGSPGGEPPLPADLGAVNSTNVATPPPAPPPTPVTVAVAASPGPPVVQPTATVAAVEANPTALPPPTAAPTPADVAADAESPCAGLPVYEVGATIETTEVLNLRDAPSIDSTVLAELPTGAQLSVTGEFSEAGQCDWWPVTVADTGQAGWVSEEYVRAPGA